MAYKNLETWLAEMMANQEHKVVALACVYEQAAGGTKEVFTLSLSGKTWDVEKVFRVFKGRAETFVQDRPGMHTFCMQAYYEGAQQPGETHTFQVIDGELKAGGQNRTINEHPTNVGLMAQLMRHVEHGQNLNTQLVTTMAATWASERVVMNQELAAARREVNDAYAIVRENMILSAQREAETRMRELEYVRTTEERRQMLGMMPSLLNDHSGRQIFPQGEADTKLIDMMAERVDPEKLDMLVQVGIIGEKEATMLKARFAASRQKKADAEKGAAKLPAGETSNVTSIVRTNKKSGTDNEGT